MKALLDWLDDRTGYRKLLHEVLAERVPGGARWRYVWGSTLTFCIFVQIVTGCFLWMAYSPSSQTAWESVFHIQHQTLGGWLLRGLHHYTAQAMVVLLVFHLAQVVIDRAYQPPREMNFWFGWLLLNLVLALSLTGYLLPWDQKGFWATKVTTNLIANTPLIGGWLQKLIVGGSEYGHHTLTRFFALHAGVLPAALIGLLAAHIYLFRRHGLTAKQPLRRPDQQFWPDQVLKDGVACLLVLGVVLYLVFRARLHDPSAPLGAELTGPADPSEPYPAARPEWYFLFLFQFLKYIPGQWETLGAIVLPGLAMTVVFLMPLLGRWKWGHRFNVAYLFGGLACIVALTVLAIRQDRNDPDYLAAVRQVEREAERVKVLALSPAGIPVEGAAALLRNDPLTQGPKLFARYCASCHRYDGHDGLGRPVAEEPTASDLKGFATREWLAGLLDPERITTAHYFGGTKHAEGRMVRFVRRNVARFTPEQQESLRKVLAAVSAEAQLKAQRARDARDAQLIEEGRALFRDEDLRCAECHQFRQPDEDATAPDLTGYGSKEWLSEFIANPAHTRFYGRRNDRMPAFRDEGILDERAIGLLADWLRGDWYEPADSALAASSENPAP